MNNKNQHASAQSAVFVTTHRKEAPITPEREVTQKQWNYSHKHIENLDEDKLKYICEQCSQGKTYGYRELCRALHIPIKSSGSNTQKAQLERLRQYCDIKKVDSQYILSNPRPCDYSYKDSRYRENATMKKFGITKEESMSECIYAIYSLETPKCVVGRTKNFNKTYTQWKYRGEVKDGMQEYILSENHSVKLWLSKRGEELPDIEDCVKEMESKGYVVVNGSNTGRKPMRKIREMKAFEDFYEAVDKACEQYGWDPDNFMERLIFHINKNPGNWMNNTFMFMVVSDFSKSNHLQIDKEQMINPDVEEGFANDYGNDYNIDFDW